MTQPIDILARRVVAPPFGGPAAVELIMTPPSTYEVDPPTPAEYQTDLWCAAWWPASKEDMIAFGEGFSGTRRLAKSFKQSHPECVACGERHEGGPLGRHCLLY